MKKQNSLQQRVTQELRASFARRAPRWESDAASISIDPLVRAIRQAETEIKKLSKDGFAIAVTREYLADAREPGMATKKLLLTAGEKNYELEFSVRHVPEGPRTWSEETRISLYEKDTVKSPHIAMSPGVPGMPHFLAAFDPEHPPSFDLFKIQLTAIAFGAGRGPAPKEPYILRVQRRFPSGV